MPNLLDRVTNKLIKQKVAVTAALVFLLVIGAIAYWAQPRFPLHPKEVKQVSFVWNYKGEEYTIEETMAAEVANYYQENEIKTYTTDTSEQPYWQKLFTNGVDKKDKIISEIASKISKIAATKNYSSDDIVELTTTFVQSLPYDDEKYALIVQDTSGSTEDIGTIEASWPRLPYETLFDNEGICTDKSLLLVKILSELGFGTALVDFPTHLAAAVQCPQAVSTYNSGYCYIESTNTGFVVGDIPVDIDGRANKPSLLTADYSTKIDPLGASIGTGTIIALNTGKSYQRATELHTLITEKNKLNEEIVQMILWFPNESDSIDNFKIDTVDAALDRANRAYATHNILQDQQSYNTYSALFDDYSALFDEYEQRIDNYNLEIEKYNEKIKIVDEVSAQISYQ